MAIGYHAGELVGLVLLLSFCLLPRVSQVQDTHTLLPSSIQPARCPNSRWPRIDTLAPLALPHMWKIPCRLVPWLNLT